jgi:hypothetical protein
MSIPHVNAIIAHILEVNANIDVNVGAVLFFEKAAI